MAIGLLQAIPTNSIPRKDQQSMSNASLKNRYPDYIPSKIIY